MASQAEQAAGIVPYFQERTNRSRVLVVYVVAGGALNLHNASTVVEGHQSCDRTRLGIPPEPIVTAVVEGA